MAVQSSPKPLTFGPSVTKGSPIDRPLDSSIRCINFRVMPPTTNNQQPYLRIRGGKKIQTNSFGAYQFYEFRPSVNTFTRYAMIQTTSNSWSLLDLASYTKTDLISISTSYGFSSGLVPCATIRERWMAFNGLGVRDGSTSKPAFSTFDGSIIRYCGLDAYCPSGQPTVSSSGSGLNSIQFFCHIYVGLMNTTTQHFSNAIYAGKIGVISGQVITVSNLDRLVPVYNNVTEQSELRYVFYASIDGGSTAYMILNSALNGPLQAAISSTSQSLSVSSISPQGFALDYTQERPTQNNPPRPMSQITYANGRVYGVLTGWGSGNSGYLQDQPAPGTTDPQLYRDFQYPLSRTKDVGAIVWSAAAGDSTANDFVGIPEESYPYQNQKYPPNGEMARICDATPGGRQVLVITESGTFILSEDADGLHQWTTVSDVDGIINTASYVRTPRGPMWLTQNRQLVLLDKDTFQLQFLSSLFEEILSGSQYFDAGQAACYVRDPKNYLEQYKVFRSDKTCLVYDFTVGGCYEEDLGDSGFITVGAGAVRNSFGKWHFIQSASGAMYTQETDPGVGRISVRDEFSTGIYTDIQATYITQFLAGTDKTEKNRFTALYLTADGSAPLTVDIFRDLNGSDFRQMILEKAAQSLTDNLYSFRVRDQNATYFKFRINMTGHQADLSPAFYPNSESINGELTPTIYGCIYLAAWTIEETGNRV